MGKTSPGDVTCSGIPTATSLAGGCASPLQSPLSEPEGDRLRPRPGGERVFRGVAGGLAPEAAAADEAGTSHWLRSLTASEPGVGRRGAWGGGGDGVSLHLAVILTVDFGKRQRVMW